MISKYPLNTIHKVINPLGDIISGRVVGYKKSKQNKVTHIKFVTQYHGEADPLVTPIGLLLKDK